MSEALRVEKVKHVFRVGDDCPFCEGKLIGGPEEEKLKCTDKNCWFNKLKLKP